MNRACPCSAGQALTEGDERAEGLAAGEDVCGLGEEGVLHGRVPARMHAGSGGTERSGTLSGEQGPEVDAMWCGYLTRDINARG